MPEKYNQPNHHLICCKGYVKRLIMATILTFVTFAAFSFDSKPHESSERALHWANSHSSSFLDGYFKVTSTSVQYLPYTLSAVLIADGLISRNKERLQKSITIGAAVAISSILVTTTKYAVAKERHYKHCPIIIKKDVGGGYTFPSGHTSDAFSLATALTLEYKKWYISVPAYVWAGSVGYGRMYQGVHSLRDVVGGVAFGIGSAYLSRKLNQWIFKR